MYNGICHLVLFSVLYFVNNASRLRCWRHWFLSAFAKKTPSFVTVSQVHFWLSVPRMLRGRKLKKFHLGYFNLWRNNSYWEIQLMSIAFVSLMCPLRVYGLHCTDYSSVSRFLENIHFIWGILKIITPTLAMYTCLCAHMLLCVHTHTGTVMVLSALEDGAFQSLSEHWSHYCLLKALCSSQHYKHYCL